MAPGRIRVFVAGTIHANRALVRRFLKDDGYEVVGEAPTRANLVAAVRRSEPDAVVVDEGLLGHETMAQLRRAAPDARIIVFTAGPTTQAAAPSGADGYLEKGGGLAALTALLVRLFTDEPPLAKPVAAGVAAAGAGRGMEVAAAAGAQAPIRTSGSVGPPSSPVGAVARLVAIASGAVLIVWGLIVMISTGGTPPPPADTTDTTRPGTVVVADSLDDAHDALDGLIAALRDGNYVLATIQAQTLMDERRQAIAEGFSLSGLDAAIAVRLDGLVGTLPLRVNATLADILRSLYPTLPDEDQPGGGSGVVTGPATGSGSPTATGGLDTGGGGDGGSPAPGGGGGGGGGGGDGGGGGGGNADDDGDDDGDGDGDDDGDDDGGDDGDDDGGDDGGDGGGDGEEGNASHANGNAWGHVKDKAQGNAWGHEKDEGDEDGYPGAGPPPWANGNANGRERKAGSHQR